ncbi:MAG: hypothetical protein SPI59_05305 [Finegoldia sp.]|nr:hypothetical protein [Finegoldia sp.]
MNIVNEFLKKINELLNKEPSDDDFDDFNDLESWFTKNASVLFGENKEICKLGDLVQDEIAKISYMEDATKEREEIRKLYEEMLKLV